MSDTALAYFNSFNLLKAQQVGTIFITHFTGEKTGERKVKNWIQVSQLVVGFEPSQPSFQSLCFDDLYYYQCLQQHKLLMKNILVRSECLISAINLQNKVSPEEYCLMSGQTPCLNSWTFGCKRGCAWWNGYKQGQKSYKEGGIHQRHVQILYSAYSDTHLPPIFPYCYQCMFTCLCFRR